MRTPHRLAPLLILPLLAGCVPAAIIGAVDATSVVVFGRGLVDDGVSAISGRDCSIVRLDRGLPYCAPPERLSGPGPFCTRTLGTVQCWSDPAAFTVLPRRLGDTPAPTDEQVRQVVARWPKSLTAD